MKKYLFPFLMMLMLTISVAACDSAGDDKADDDDDAVADDDTGDDDGDSDVGNDDIDDDFLDDDGDDDTDYDDDGDDSNDDDWKSVEVSVTRAAADAAGAVVADFMVKENGVAVFSQNNTAPNPSDGDGDIYPASLPPDGSAFVNLKNANGVSVTNLVPVTEMGVDYYDPDTAVWTPGTVTESGNDEWKLFSPDVTPVTTTTTTSTTTSTSTSTSSTTTTSTTSTITSTTQPCAGCFVDGVCYADGTLDPANSCLWCNVAASPTAWSNNNGATCDDGLFCNGADTCSAGTCSVHASNPCADDGLFCNGTESCDEVNNQCATTGNPCPDDSLFCDGVESCDENANTCVSSGDPCPNDGLFCDGIESCDEVNNQCATTGNPCGDDGLFCNGTESCDEVNNQCATTGNPCGDDGLICNGTESCDENANTCVSSGDPCPDDGLFCNGEESCDEVGNQCATTGNPCGDDGLICNGTESCNETLAMCEHSGGTICPDDGLYCNGVETCDDIAGECGHAGDPCGAGFLCSDVADACVVDQCPVGDSCVLDYGEFLIVAIATGTNGEAKGYGGTLLTANINQVEIRIDNAGVHPKGVFNQATGRAEIDTNSATYTIDKFVPLPMVGTSYYWPYLEPGDPLAADWTFVNCEVDMSGGTGNARIKRTASAFSDANYWVNQAAADAVGAATATFEVKGYTFTRPFPTAANGKYTFPLLLPNS